MKIYSMCGEMLLRWKNFKLAIAMYTKLLNAAYTDESERSDFKLYALKQIAFSYIHLKEYDTALVTLKKQL